MIELKSDRIILQDGICVLREDILSALNRYLSLSQNIAFDSKASGLIYADKNNPIENTIEISSLFQENICSYQGLDFNFKSSLDKEQRYDWIDVYNIATQFLPEEADKIAPIDEHLWQSLDSTEILDDCNSSFIDFFNNLNS
ncbi:hypothetical protein CU098_013397 [Rhizopus stolonifer]|uniref:Uncharacterized protein n=1 Tax=Rhizopus stolonifer TaxID=4846 RepID=A0A367KYG5_RHIST|nr:hypothetical protein CU098_013397 [Rhizopus stolonifer]